MRSWPISEMLPISRRSARAVDGPAAGLPHDQAVDQHDGGHPGRDEDRYTNELAERSAIQQPAGGPDEQPVETGAPESRRTQIRKVDHRNPPFRAPIYAPT